MPRAATLPTAETAEKEMMHIMVILKITFAAVPAAPGALEVAVLVQASAHAAAMAVPAELEGQDINEQAMVGTLPMAIMVVQAMPVLPLEL